MSKYSEIADIIRDEIRNGLYSKEGRLPTEYELVSRFGVSRQTIRQAIANLKNDGTVYQVQGSGTYISKPGLSKKNREFPNVLVICTYISEYIFPSIIRGIESELAASNCRMHLAATSNRVDVERRILNAVIAGGDVDGIIVEGTKTGFPNPNVSLYRNIREMGIPVVFLHCTYPELENTVVVGMNDYEGGRLAAKTLITAGCVKVGGIFKSDDRQGLLRYSGFVDAAIEGGLSLESIKTRWFTTEDTIDQDYSLTKEQLDSLIGDDLDGLVCYNDQLAVAVGRDCSKYGVRLPRLFSFDHSYLCDISPIDSIGHLKEELGRVAAEKICNMLKGKAEQSVFFDWLPLKEA